MSDAIFTFTTPDGLSYDASLTQLHEWLSQGRIGLDDVVTDKTTGATMPVRSLVTTESSQSAPPVTIHPDPAEPPPKINNNLAKAIISTVCFGCTPIGIVAIIFAAQVDGLCMRGEYEAARLASRRANIWANISIWVLAAYFGIWLLGTVFAYTSLIFPLANEVNSMSNQPFPEAKAAPPKPAKKPTQKPSQ